MSVYNEFVASNQQFAQSFTHGEKPLPPRRHVAVVTCMDARLHPEKFLGLEIGDAHVIRNAGGRVSEDAIRSLVISQRLLGTNEVVIIHHTDCGMVTFNNEQITQQIRHELNADASHIDFLPFKDLEQSVRDDVQAVRSSPLIPKNFPISGAIYDVRSGKLSEVVQA